MSDDIDIEEHDLLQHPALRSVFPDLACVKQEVDDDSEDQSSVFWESEAYLEEQKCPLRFEDDDIDEFAAGYEDRLGQEKQPESLEKPDSTSDLVVGVLQHTPIEYPLVTSSQLTASSPTLAIPTPTEGTFGNDGSDTILGEVADNHNGTINKENAVSDDVVSINVILNERGALEVDASDNGGETDNEREIYAIDLNSATHERTHMENGMLNERNTCSECDITEEVEDTFNDTDEIIEPFVEERCLRSYVSVKNYGPILDSSKRYCTECQTLFPTNNILAAHNMAEHSFLMEKSVADPMEATMPERNIKKEAKYSCPECPVKFTQRANMYRHHANKHKGSAEQLSILKQYATSPVTNIPNPMKVTAPAVTYKPASEAFPKKSVVEGPLCQICNATFSSTADLIVHLYDHATGDVPKTQMHKCDYCAATFPQKKFLESHLLSHARSRQPSTSSVASALSVQAPSEAGTGRRDRAAASDSEGRSRVKTEMRYTAATSRAINRCLLGSDESFVQSGESATSLARSPADPEDTDLEGEKYKCPVCGQYLCTAYNYFKHMSTVHKRRESSAPPPARLAPSDIACRACAMSFTSVLQYNRHNRLRHINYSCKICQVTVTGSSDLIAHRKRHLIQGEVGGVNSNLKIKYLYKCVLCHASFQSHGLGQQHQRARHPAATGKIIVRSTQMLILKKGSATTLPKVASALRKGIKRKYMLLQCSRCEHPLINSDYALKAHRVGDSCDTKLSVCLKCGLTMVYSSRFGHYKQHGRSKALAAWDFIVVTESGERVPFDLKATVGRLPRCSRCGVVFNSQIASLQCDCKWTGTVECEECDATFSAKTYAWHMAVLHGTKQEIQPRTQSNNTQMIKPILVRCHKCKTHVYAGPSTFMHCKTDCSKLQPRVCLQCGLTFADSALERHAREHGRSERPLTMSDFTVVSTLDRQPVRRELCPFPACRLCGARHVGSGDSEHGSVAACRREPAVSCATCELTFTAAAYPLHVGYFGCEIALKDPTVEAKRKGPAEGVDNELTSNPRKRKLLPKVGEVKNSKRRIRRTLYKCGKCDVHFMTKKNALKHYSRPAAQHVESKHRARPLCKGCGFKFTLKSWSAHFQLYHVHNHFVRSDFTVETVPADLKAPRAELYKCGKCEAHFVTSEQALRHYHRPAASHTTNYRTTCTQCGLKFTYKVMKVHNELHHERTNYKRSDFAITNINGKYKEVAEPRNDIGPEEEPALVVKRVPRKLKAARPALYKCDKCETLFLTRKQALKHYYKAADSHTDCRRRICKKCGFKFTIPVLAIHNELHHQQKKYKRSDFAIINISKDKEKKGVVEPRKAVGAEREPVIVKTVATKPKAPRATLYKCGKCETYFLTSKHALRHYRSPPASHTANYRTICTKCGFKFTYKVLTVHNKLHHQQKKYKRSDFLIKDITYKEQEDVTCKEKEAVTESRRDEAVEREILSTNKTRAHVAKVYAHELEIKSPILYKCTECGLHLLRRQAQWAHVAGHRKPRSRSLPRTTCRICGFCFGSRTYEIHCVLHHDLTQRKRSDFTVLNINSSTDAGKSTVRKGAKFLTKNRLVLGTTAKAKPKVPVASRDKGEVSAGSEKVRNPQNVVYRCTPCDVCYTSRETLVMHLYRSRHTVLLPSSITACDTCGLNFSKKSLYTHKRVHHAAGNLGEVTIVDMSPKSGERARSREQVTEYRELMDAYMKRGEFRASDISSDGSGRRSTGRSEGGRTEDEGPYENVEYLDENVDVDSISSGSAVAAAANAAAVL